ncbi:hypothetical protein Tsubulata_050606 [Turnera subulata]|uniref:NAF domain-containing protein n=1 Tax=Turnera subulata TaxID=218843 RepID=A0A9Q0J104_9ROSI|nr:hypothetical protein Tsubulata_050606 [Turnera subulata]
MDVARDAAPAVPAAGHESPDETLDEILHDPWFRKDYEETKFHMEDFFLELKESGGGDMDRTGEEEDGEEKRLNAFDLISLSPGFDLSGLFNKSDVSKNAPEKSNFSSTAIRG